jgi:predicted choloylglycine hydrolase
MEKENLNVDFTANWTPGKVAKFFRNFESEENQKLVNTEEMENVEKRRIFVEEYPEIYQELKNQPF